MPNKTEIFTKENWPYEVIILALKHIGFWRGQDSAKYGTSNKICYLICFLFLILGLVNLLINEMSIIGIADCLSFNFAVWHGILKGLLLCYYSPEIESVILEINYTKLSEATSSLLRRIITTRIILAIVLISGIIVDAAAISKTGNLFKAYLPYDPTSNDVAFYSTLLATSFLTIVPTCGFLLTENFVGATFLYIVERMRWLQYEISTIGERTDDEYIALSAESKHEVIKEELYACISHQQTIYRWIATLKPTIDKLILMYVISVTIELSLEGVVIVIEINDGNYSTIGNPLLYTTCLVGLGMATCFFSDNIIIESLALTESYYSVSWFDWPETLKKDLIFAMARCQKPCFFAVGGYEPYSMEFFLLILSTCYRFFAVLHDML